MHPATLSGQSRGHARVLRIVLWGQTMWLTYAVIVTRLEHSGVLDFWTVTAAGLNDYTVVGQVVLGGAALSWVSACAVFPPLVLVLLIRHPSPRPLLSCLLAELALFTGNVFTMLIWL